MAGHARGGQPRTGLCRGATTDLCAPAARGALHALARGVSRRRGDALGDRLAAYSTQICVGHSTPSLNPTAGVPSGVFGLAKFCTFGLATTAHWSRASHTYG